MWKKEIEKSKKNLSTGFPQSFPQAKRRYLLNIMSFPQFPHICFPHVNNSFPHPVESVNNYSFFVFSISI